MLERQWDFRRLTRTASSEQWLIWGGNGRVGSFDVHYTDLTHATLVVEADLTETEVEELVQELDEQIASSGPRKDFLLTIFRGTDMAFWSDGEGGEGSLRPLTRGEFERSLAGLRRMVGRGQDARAQLNELVACEYFRCLGYSAEPAPPDLDHEKVDVVAENDAEIVFCQVKLGGIKGPTIKSLVDFVASTPHEKQKAAALIAEEFPLDVERLRLSCEAESGVRLWVIHKAQVLAALPRFKGALGRD